jgi:hypothetical protein
MHKSGFTWLPPKFVLLSVATDFCKADFYEARRHFAPIFPFDRGSEWRMTAHYHFDEILEGPLITPSLGDPAVWQMKRLIIMEKTLHLLWFYQEETDDPVGTIGRNACFSKTATLLNAANHDLTRFRVIECNGDFWRDFF